MSEESALSFCDEKIVHSTLLDFLKCQVCHEFHSPSKLRVCTNKHAVCDDCVAELTDHDVCVTCRSEDGYEVNPRWLRVIASLVIAPCPQCNQPVKLDETERHANERCRNRPFACPLSHNSDETSPKFTVNDIPAFVGHLQECHACDPVYLTTDTDNNAFEIPKGTRFKDGCIVISEKSRFVVLICTTRRKIDRDIIEVSCAKISSEPLRSSISIFCQGSAMQISADIVDFRNLRRDRQWTHLAFIRKDRFAASDISGTLELMRQKEKEKGTD